jgi:hypothetical protein
MKANDFQPRSFLPLRARVDVPPFHYLTPYPQELKAGEGRVLLGGRQLLCEAGSEAAEIARDFVTDCWSVARLQVTREATEGAYPIRLEIRDVGLREEGYTLEIGERETVIVGQTAAGLFYGTQTFLQLAGFEKGELPVLVIRDWPVHTWRGVMLDMGRGVYTKALIERCIRIMARLKLNFLHLHLFDDEIMGVRFNTLELGKENPQAIPIDQLGDLVKYARRYHITVCPEIESWGHVNSVVYHYRDCYGAPGMWGGSSFGIGERTISLLERMYDEVVPHLEDKCFVHLGLDEANWAVLPDFEGREEINPEWLVGRLHDVLMEVGKRHGKEITLCIWADHGGRPVPERIRDKVIVMPWQYWELRYEDIETKVQRFSGEGKPPFMAGGGKSGQAHNGTFGATRLWSQQTKGVANCLGVDITLWSGNSVERYLVSMYAGAAACWNPDAAFEAEERDIHRETLTGETVAQMMSWQTLFEDANEEAIIRDRGPAVFVGYYVNGPRAGEPVAPTAIPVNQTVKDMTV